MATTPLGKTKQEGLALGQDLYASTDFGSHPTGVLLPIAKSILGRPRQLFSEDEKQDFGLVPRGERDRPFGRDAGTVTGGQNEVAQGCLTLHEVQPCASPLRELVDHV